MATNILTVEYVRSRVNYDEFTGHFSHITSFGSRFSAGDRADTPGHCGLTGYRLINLLSKKYLAHRVAWLCKYGRWPDGVIDHIDGNKGNNAIANLRDVSHRKNIENQRRPSKRSATGYLGVFHCNGRYRARINVNAKMIHLGMYDTPEAASAAYISAKRRLHEGCTL